MGFVLVPHYSVGVLNSLFNPTWLILVFKFYPNRSQLVQQWLAVPPALLSRTSIHRLLYPYRYPLRYFLFLFQFSSNQDYRKARIY